MYVWKTKDENILFYEILPNKGYICCNKGTRPGECPTVYAEWDTFLIH